MRLLSRESGWCRNQWDTDGKHFLHFLVPRNSVLINVLSNPAFKIHAHWFSLHWKLSSTCSHELRHTGEEGRASGARGSHSTSHSCEKRYMKVSKCFPQESRWRLDFVLGTEVPQAQWLRFLWKYLTEDIPLTNYESLKTYFSTGPL